MSKKLLFRRNFEKYSFKFAVTIAVIGILLFTLMSGHIFTETFAAKPSSGFLNTVNCSYSKNFTKKTCCWRETAGTYKYPTPTYCQTCNSHNGTYSNCTDPELQMLIDPDKIGDLTNPSDNGGVLSNNEEGSSGSKGVDSDTVEKGGTYTENSGPGNSGVPKGIDPNNSGGVFSQ